MHFMLISNQKEASLSSCLAFDSCMFVVVPHCYSMTSIADAQLLLQLDTLYVDLSENNLTGTLPSSWANLTQASHAIT